MTTKECFDRLAAVGTHAEGLCFDRDHGTFYFYSRNARITEMPETYAVALLCNAVLERHPDWNVHRVGRDSWSVSRQVGVTNARIDIAGAPTRLAALTLAAERVAKEKA